MDLLILGLCRLLFLLRVGRLPRQDVHLERRLNPLKKRDNASGHEACGVFGDPALKSRLHKALRF